MGRGRRAFRLPADGMLLPFLMRHLALLGLLLLALLLFMLGLLLLLTLLLLLLFWAFPGRRRQALYLPGIMGLLDRRYAEAARHPNVETTARPGVHLPSDAST